MASTGDLRESLRWFLLALAGVTVLAVIAGYLFGRATPERAAGTLIDDFVVTEPVGEPPGDAAAPTSGEVTAAPGCGVREEPLAPAVQVASLDAGIVVIQYRPGELESEQEVVLTRMVEASPESAVLAPNPDLGSPVAVTAWGRRMPLAEANEQLISAFLTAHGRSAACTS
ncbi:MAG: DUF3105 domain-containing protein [Nitriliruptorales bacterium]|nr:DUF3105 domain-containing protein [Nitriliruptorales bacterium]